MINIIENFISDNEADILVNCFRKHKYIEFGDNKFFHWTYPNDEYIEVEDKIVDILNKLQSIFQKEYNPANLHLKRAVCQTFAQGANLMLHSDEKLATLEDGYEQKAYSAILFLNDDYLGGEIEFPLHKLSLKPNKGSMIYFEGNQDNLHRVKTVLGGERINIVIFFRADVK